MCMWARKSAAWAPRSASLPLRASSPCRCTHTPCTSYRSTRAHAQVFDHHGLRQSCRIDRATFGRFLLRAEHGYGANPYHNSMHAADVLMSTHLFLTKYGLVTRLTHLELLAALLGAIVHDFNHPGTTNAHEVKVRLTRLTWAVSPPPAGCGRPPAPSTHPFAPLTPFRPVLSRAGAVSTRDRLLGFVSARAPSPGVCLRAHAR